MAVEILRVGNTDVRVTFKELVMDLFDLAHFLHGFDGRVGAGRAVEEVRVRAVQAGTVLGG